MPAATPDPTSVPDPIAVWRQAMDDLRDAAVRAQWRQPSVLPGWTVADIVAHVTFIERAQLGRVDAAHEPAWDALPHVTSAFGRITEVPVDLRRSWSRDEVLEEFDTTMADREAALRALWAADPEQMVMNPLGAMMPLREVLAMRVFDTWVHEQDIRVAVHDPGHLDTAAAHVAAGRMRRSLGFIWAKKVQAPIGSTLQVAVTGPGVAFTDAVTRGDDGRGRTCPPVADPTVALTMDFPAFVARMCGRSKAPVTATGDTELAERTIASLNIAP